MKIYDFVLLQTLSSDNNVSYFNISLNSTIEHYNITVSSAIPSTTMTLTANNTSKPKYVILKNDVSYNFSVHYQRCSKRKEYNLFSGKINKKLYSKLLTTEGILYF